jgi:hypothetical protein
MNAHELLKWLEAIPENELKHAAILLEICGDIAPMVTAKYYKTKCQPSTWCTNKGSPIRAVIRSDIEPYSDAKRAGQGGSRNRQGGQRVG